MPFKSKKQQAFLWAKEPKIAKKWTKKYGSLKDGGKVESKLKEHSKHHTKKHMTEMKKQIKKGKTFNQAHKIAQKKVGN